MVICSGIAHWKWWFSIVMLVYQRVRAIDGKIDDKPGDEYGWMVYVQRNPVTVWCWDVSRCSEPFMGRDTPQGPLKLNHEVEWGNLVFQRRQDHTVPCPDQQSPVQVDRQSHSSTNRLRVLESVREDRWWDVQAGSSWWNIIRSRSPECHLQACDNPEARTIASVSRSYSTPKDSSVHHLFQESDAC